MNHARSIDRRLLRVAASLVVASLLGGCAVVAVTTTVAGAAVSVASTVVVTGVKVTGKAIGAAVDAVTPDDTASAAK